MIFTKRPRSNYSLSCCALCFLVHSFLPLVQHDFLHNSVYTCIFTYMCVYVYITITIEIYLNLLCAYCVVSFLSNTCFLTPFYLKGCWKVDFILNYICSRCSVSDDCWIGTFYWLSYAIWHNWARPYSIVEIPWALESQFWIQFLLGIALVPTFEFTSHHL